MKTITVLKINNTCENMACDLSHRVYLFFTPELNCLIDHVIQDDKRRGRCCTNLNMKPCTVAELNPASG